MYDMVLVFLFLTKRKFSVNHLMYIFFLSVQSLLRFGDSLLKCMQIKVESMKEKLSSIIHSLRYNYFSQYN